MIKRMLLLVIFLFGGVLCSEDGVGHPEYKTIGTIYPQYKTVLGSQVAGCVEEVCVEVGDKVHKGDVVLWLDPTLFSLAVAEAHFGCDLARIECQNAERDFVRMKKLFEKPVGETPSISQKRFEMLRVVFIRLVSLFIRLKKF